MSGYTQAELRRWNSGYAIEKENQSQLMASLKPMPYTSRNTRLPENFDPRADPKFAEGWLRTEDQSTVGACQGYSLTENVEFNFAVETGKIKQFCPMVAYVVSQRFDGINGDRGSTLDGGTKCASQFGFVEVGRGLPEGRYPSGGPRAVTNAMERAAADTKLKSAVDISDPEAAKAFIGTYQGLGQFGTPWTEGLAKPTSSGVIRSVGGRNYGGHAYTLAGYLSVDSLPESIKRDLPRTRYSWVWIIKNSHSLRWGDKGFAYMTVELFVELLKMRWAIIVGRSNLETIEPRRSKIDFTKQTWFG